MKKMKLQVLRNVLMLGLAMFTMNAFSQVFQASIGPQMAIGFNEFEKYDAKPGIGFNVEGAYVLRSSLSITAGVNHLSYQAKNGPYDQTLKFTSGQVGIRYGGYPGDFYGSAALGACFLGGDFLTETPLLSPTIGVGYLVDLKRHFLDVGLRYNNINLNSRQWSSIALKVAFGFQFGKREQREPSREDMKGRW
ncbi:MAG TPA: hypothetical protein VLC98_15085 [Phnomibacter sp.]|nr:hypothetical protein [Phnomibacter sp.]